MGRQIFKYPAPITSIFSTTLCVQTVATGGAGHRPEGDFIDSTICTKTGVVWYKASTDYLPS